MAVKKKVNDSPKDNEQTEGNTQPKVDYKDSSLHHDLAEIKLLLGCMLKDIDKLSENINVVTRIEKIRAGMGE